MNPSARSVIVRSVRSSGLAVPGARTYHGASGPPRQSPALSAGVQEAFHEPSSNGSPRFGLVYAPARSLLATTPASGKAIEVTVEPSEHGADLAALDCRNLHVRTPAPDGLVAVVSRSHLDPATESFLAKLKIAGRSDAGSALKFLEVARGAADVYPRFGPTMEWDTAAGHAILMAAGGYVEDAEGKPLRYGKTGTGLLNPGFVAWGQRTAGA